MTAATAAQSPLGTVCASLTPSACTTRRTRTTWASRSAPTKGLGQRFGRRATPAAGSERAKPQPSGQGARDRISTGRSQGSVRLLRRTGSPHRPCVPDRQGRPRRLVQPHARMRAVQPHQRTALWDGRRLRQLHLCNTTLAGGAEGTRGPTRPACRRSRDAPARRGDGATLSDGLSRAGPGWPET